MKRKHDQFQQCDEGQTTVPLMCEIRVQGHLNESWSLWFDGLTITNSEDGQTVLRGGVEDHAALYGLLAQVRDLGLRLISVHVTTPP